MKKPATIKFFIVVGALASASFAFADMSAADVLNTLHQADHMEIHMGKLAQEKGSVDAVKDYGKTLVNDHQDNDKKVTDMASKDNITLKAAKPGMLNEMEMKHMKSLTGSDFDKAFAKKMIDDHKDNIAKLQKAQESPLPEDVRGLVSDTLPALQKHLEMAQKIYGQPS